MSKDASAPLEDTKNQQDMRYLKQKIASLPNGIVLDSRSVSTTANGDVDGCTDDSMSKCPHSDEIHEDIQAANRVHDIAVRKSRTPHFN